MENIFSSLLLTEDALRVDPSGIAVDIRLPWYRSLPLSVVDVPRLAIADTEIARQEVLFEVNGKRFALDGLGDLTGEFWFVLDRAVLRAKVPGLKTGERYAVELQLDLYPPYIPHLKWVTRSKRLLLAGHGTQEH